MLNVGVLIEPGHIIRSTKATKQAYFCGRKHPHLIYLQGQYHHIATFALVDMAEKSRPWISQALRSILRERRRKSSQLERKILQSDSLLLTSQTKPNLGEASNAYGL